MLTSRKNGLKDRRPEFLLLPEVVSVINLLQTLADARLRVDWLAWGGDWLPGTVIERCLSQLSAANINDSTRPPRTPPSLPAAAVSHAPTQSSSCRLGVPITPPQITAANAASPAPVSATCSVKRAALNEVK